MFASSLLSVGITAATVARSSAPGKGEGKMMGVSSVVIKIESYHSGTNS